MTRANARLRLVDAMILVAAVAFGLAWVKFLTTKPSHVFNHFGPPFTGFGEPAGPAWQLVLARAWHKYTLIAPVMATLAVGLLAVRLRGAGGDRSRRAMQPGASACLAIVVVLAISSIRLVVDLALLRVRMIEDAARGAMVFDDWWQPAYSALRPDEPGLALLACWAGLALAGRLRCERSMIDRLGRIIAVYWILAMAWAWISAGE